MLAALCLAIASALAIRQLGARWPRYARAIPVLACLGMLIDAWPVPIVMEKRPADRPNHTRAVARLDLPPVPSHDSISLYRATEHRRPLFNGYSGYFAPHYSAMEYMIKHHDPALLARLSSFGPIEVVIDHDWDPDAGLRRFLGSAPQSTLLYRDDRYSAFRVERGPYSAALPKLQGQSLPIASISAAFNAAIVGAMIDHDIMSRSVAQSRSAWCAGKRRASSSSGAFIASRMPRDFCAKCPRFTAFAGSCRFPVEECDLGYPPPHAPHRSETGPTRG